MLEKWFVRGLQRFVRANTDVGDADFVSAAKTNVRDN